MTVALDAALRPGQGVEGFNLDATQTQRHKAERIAVSPPQNQRTPQFRYTYHFFPRWLSVTWVTLECYLGNTQPEPTGVLRGGALAVVLSSQDGVLHKTHMHTRIVRVDRKSVV